MYTMSENPEVLVDFASELAGYIFAAMSKWSGTVMHILLFPLSQGVVNHILDNGLFHPDVKT